MFTMFDVGDTTFGSIRRVEEHGHNNMATSAAKQAQRIKTLLFEIQDTSDSSYGTSTSNEGLSRKGG